MPKKIFIVEDNGPNLRLFHDILQREGFEVAFTQNGFEAFERIKGEVPDLILMDIQLGGISGLDIIREIKQDARVKNIPIIAITAFASKNDKMRVLASGCEEYMPKPVPIKPFIKKVYEYLHIPYTQEEKEGSVKP